MPLLQLLDSISLPGSPARANEDAFGAGEAIACVLDGVTSVGDAPLLEGPSDPAWVSALARDLLLRHGAAFAGDPRGLITIVAEGITEAFARERLREPGERYELPWTTVSFVSVTPGVLHFAYLGDSRILVETADGEIHFFGTNPTRSAFEQKLSRKVVAERSGLSVEVVRGAVLSDLRRARNTVNTGTGYWLLGADPAAAAHAGVTSLKIDAPVTVLLATDGFYALKEDYGELDERALIAAAKGSGLEALAARLREIEDGDPMGERFPRMKKSDDATAVLARVTP